IPNPTTLAVVNMDPLKGSAVLEIDPSITFTIIDKLFGGTGEPTKISRELTDIELSVMEGIVVRILGNLREAWSNVIDLRPRLGNIETNPQFAQIVPPSEMVVLITLETKVGDVEGMTNLCLPYITIEPVISKLSAQYWFSSVRKGATDENLQIIQNRLENVSLDVVAEIGSVMVTMEEVLNLTPGDVVKLPKTKTDSDMTLKIEGRRKFKCRPGMVGNRIAVQIGEKIEEVPDELLITKKEEDEMM
ncbi:MAG: flagellar motor switch protein FliM, partial [Spirochaetota bacterium]